MKTKVLYYFVFKCQKFNQYNYIDDIVYSCFRHVLPVKEIRALHRNRIERQSAKTELRMHLLHPFFKNFLGEIPTPPPFCKKIKNYPLLLYNMILGATAEVKISPASRISGVMKAKLTHNLGGGVSTRIRQKNGFKMHYLHQFFKKNFPGEAPGTPPTGWVSPSPPLRRLEPIWLRPGKEPSGSVT